MKKKFTYTIVSLFLLLSACTSQAESKRIAENVLGEDLDSLSFDELKLSVVQTYAQFSMFNAFMGFGEEDETTKYKEEDEQYDVFFTLPSIHEESDFVKGISFQQSLEYPSSTLKINSEIKEDDSERITYFLDKIYYNDGTADSLDTSISSTHDLDMRKADSVKITVRYRHTTRLDAIKLTPSSKNVKYKDGTISVESVKDNNIEYVMSDNISGSFVVGQALSASGKALSRRGYSSGDLPPKERKAKYDKIFKVVEKIALKVEADEYKTKDDLIKDVYKAAAALGSMPESDKYYRSERYYGNVDALMLYFTKDKKTEDFTFTVPVNSEIEGYNLVWNETVTGKFIVDNKGKVIVNSGLKDVQQINGRYYALINYYDDAVLFLNAETNRLDTLKPYKSKNVSYLTGDLALLSYRNKNGVLGKDGLLIIPAIYDEIKITSENIIVAADKGTFKFFDFDANLLFEGKGTIGAYVDGLAIHRSADRDNIAFVDRMGKAVLSISQYSTVEPFAEGLAVVEKNRKWGAIRKDGSIAIPLEYDELRDFSYGVTLVKRGEMYGLINTNNEFIVPLDRTGGYSISENFGKRSYYMNGRTYDEKGKLKEEDN